VVEALQARVAAVAAGSAAAWRPATQFAPPPALTPARDAQTAAVERQRETAAERQLALPDPRRAAEPLVAARQHLAERQRAERRQAAP
jgi:hypothetical protein